MHTAMLHSNIQHRIEGLKVNGNTEHMLHTCLPGRSDRISDLPLVGAQVETIKVTMGIDEHSWRTRGDEVFLK